MPRKRSRTVQLSSDEDEAGSTRDKGNNVISLISDDEANGAGIIASQVVENGSKEPSRRRVSKRQRRKRHNDTELDGASAVDSDVPHRVLRPRKAAGRTIVASAEDDSDDDFIVDDAADTKRKNRIKASRARKRRTKRKEESATIEIHSDSDVGDRAAELREKLLHVDLDADKSVAVLSRQKNAELRQWLACALDGTGPRLLVLHGPPGCGKWSGLRALAGERNLQPVEWTPPAHVGGSSSGASVLGGMLDSLQAFLSTAAYPSLTASDKRVVVVRELPVAVRDFPPRVDDLRAMLAHYARTVRLPSVIMLSDNDKAIGQQLQLLGDECTERARVVRVHALSAIAARKALAAIAPGASRKALNTAADACGGDLRAAINTLRLGGGACTSGGKDEHLAIFHAVSKVLNNKRAECGASKYDAEQLVDNTKAESSTWHTFLYHNYPRFFSRADDAADALAALSDADVVAQWSADAGAREDLSRCATSVAVRAFIAHNTDPIRTGWRPISGPDKHLDTAARLRRTSLTSTFARPEVVTRSSVLERSSYLNIINGSRRPSAAARPPRAVPKVDSEGESKPSSLSFDGRMPSADRTVGQDNDAIEEWTDKD